MGVICSVGPNPYWIRRRTVEATTPNRFAGCHTPDEQPDVGFGSADKRMRERRAEIIERVQRALAVSHLVEDDQIVMVN